MYYMAESAFSFLPKARYDLGFGGDGVFFSLADERVLGSGSAGRHTFYGRWIAGTAREGDAEKCSGSLGGSFWLLVMSTPILEREDDVSPEFCSVERMGGGCKRLDVSFR